MTSNHVILSHSLLLLPSIFPSFRVFSKESALCIRCPKYWSFSFSISLSSENSGLISLRIDWFNLLPVQGTLKSFFLHVCVCVCVCVCVSVAQLSPTLCDPMNCSSPNSSVYGILQARILEWVAITDTIIHTYLTLFY